VEDTALGEVIAVRSMVYLALTYDHRLVDGADAARFLTTVKNRLEEGAFEAELGLLPGLNEGRRNRLVRLDRDRAGGQPPLGRAPGHQAGQAAAEVGRRDPLGSACG